MSNDYCTRQRALLTAVILASFVAGAAAQRLAGGVSMRGTVMDANTLPESVEYWEVRAPTGESVVLTGRGDLPLMRGLRQLKNRPVTLTIDVSADPSPPPVQPDR